MSVFPEMQSQSSLLGYAAHCRIDRMRCFTDLSLDID
jgi:hypothetical protein